MRLGQLQFWNHWRRIRHAWGFHCFSLTGWTTVENIKKQKYFIRNLHSYIFRPVKHFYDRRGDRKGTRIPQLRPAYNVSSWKQGRAKCIRITINLSSFSHHFIQGENERRKMLPKSRVSTKAKVTATKTTRTPRTPRLPRNPSTPLAMAKHLLHARNIQYRDNVWNAHKLICLCSRRI